MTRNQFRQLIIESYGKNGVLNKENVQRIANLIRRSELKKYIKMIKKREEEKTITISLPMFPSEKEQKRHKILFPNKLIIYDIDPTLIIGIKVKDTDLITEYNLKDTLESLYTHLTEYYD